jgi:poly(3-hydroxybutyrate) depolymerase
VKAIGRLFLFFLSTILLALPVFAGWRWDETTELRALVYEPQLQAGLHGLALVLHGCGQIPENIATESNWAVTAERYNMTVVLPEVPNGGVVYGCWDYYGTDQNPQNKGNIYLIHWLETYLKVHPEIEKTRVIAAGLSSGGSQAALLACMRPDLIFGLGLVASPAVSTGMWDIKNPLTSSEVVGHFCASLSGPKKNLWAQRKVSVIQDPLDPVASPVHSHLNQSAFSNLAGVASEKAFDVRRIEGSHLGGSGLMGYDSQGTARVSMMWIANLGHNWPSFGVFQPGAYGYVNPYSLNYSGYLCDFLLGDGE